MENMTTNELIERRTAIGEECMTATGEALDALETELDNINTELETRKAAEEKRQNIRATVAAGAGEVVTEIKEERKTKMTFEEMRGSDRYLNAFVNYLKTGRDTECRGIMTELAGENIGETDGVLPVPVLVDNMIAESWNRSRLIARVRRTNLKGVVRFPFEASSTGASVHAEGADAPDEETLILGNVTVTPTTLKKWITITDEVMSLHGQAFLDYIWDEIEQKIYELADTAIVNLIATASTTVGTDAVSVAQVSAGAGATAIFAGLAELADGASNPVAIMSKPTFFNTIMSAVDDNNRPIFNVVSDNGRPAYYANGVEVILNSSVTDDTVIVGDLSGIVANFPDGDTVRFVNDPYTLAAEDRVKIVGKMYVGLGLIRDKYFAVVTITDEGGDT